MLNIHPKVRKKGKDILVALAITLILLIVIFPVLMLFLTSIKSQVDAFRHPT